MRAVIYQKHGGIEHLELVDIDDPELRSTEVLVKVHSIGLNPLDYRLRRGEMGPLTLFNRHRLIGSDFSGRVVEVGERVSGLSVGDRVFGMVFQPMTGTSAERISVNPKNLCVTPYNLDDATAATVPLASLTAYQALHNLAQVQPNQRVLVNGASGGVGTYAVQLAKLAGAHVTAVTSYRNTSWMPKIGADTVIDYTNSDCCQGDPSYDVFFDCYGNRSFAEACSVLKPQGIYVSTIPAIRTFSSTLLNPLRSQKSKVVMVSSKSSDLAVIKTYIENGQLVPIVDEVFDVARIKDAYEKLETKRAKGKIAVTISHR